MNEPNSQAIAINSTLITTHFRSICVQYDANNVQFMRTHCVDNMDEMPKFMKPGTENDYPVLAYNIQRKVCRHKKDKKIISDVLYKCNRNAYIPSQCHGKNYEGKAMVAKIGKEVADGANYLYICERIGKKYVEVTNATVTVTKTTHVVKQRMVDEVVFRRKKCLHYEKKGKYTEIDVDRKDLVLADGTRIKCTNRTGFVEKIVQTIEVRHIKSKEGCADPLNSENEIKVGDKYSFNGNVYKCESNLTLRLIDCVDESNLSIPIDGIKPSSDSRHKNGKTEVIEYCMMESGGLFGIGYANAKKCVTEMDEEATFGTTYEDSHSIKVCSRNQSTGPVVGVWRLTHCVFGTIKVKKGECFYAFNKYQRCDEDETHEPIYRPSDYESCSPEKEVIITNSKGAVVDKIVAQLTKDVFESTSWVGVEVTETKHNKKVETEEYSEDYTSKGEEDDDETEETTSEKQIESTDEQKEDTKHVIDSENTSASKRSNVAHSKDTTHDEIIAVSTTSSQENDSEESIITVKTNKHGDGFDKRHKNGSFVRIEEHDSDKQRDSFEEIVADSKEDEQNYHSEESEVRHKNGSFVHKTDRYEHSQQDITEEAVEDANQTSEPKKNTKTSSGHSTEITSRGEVVTDFDKSDKTRETKEESEQKSRNQEESFEESRSLETETTDLPELRNTWVTARTKNSEEHRRDWSKKSVSVDDHETDENSKSAETPGLEDDNSKTVDVVIEPSKQIDDHKTATEKYDDSSDTTQEDNSPEIPENGQTPGEDNRVNPHDLLHITTPEPDFFKDEEKSSPEDRSKDSVETGKSNESENTETTTDNGRENPNKSKHTSDNDDSSGSIETTDQTERPDSDSKEMHSENSVEKTINVEQSVEESKSTEEVEPEVRSPHIPDDSKAHIADEPPTESLEEPSGSIEGPSEEISFTVKPDESKHGSGGIIETDEPETSSEEVTTESPIPDETKEKSSSQSESTAEDIGETEAPDNKIASSSHKIESTEKEKPTSQENEVKQSEQPSRETPDKSQAVDQTDSSDIEESKEPNTSDDTRATEGDKSGDESQSLETTEKSVDSSDHTSNDISTPQEKEANDVAPTENISEEKPDPTASSDVSIEVIIKVRNKTHDAKPKSDQENEPGKHDESSSSEEPKEPHVDNSEIIEEQEEPTEQPTEENSVEEPLNTSAQKKAEEDRKGGESEPLIPDKSHTISDDLSVGPNESSEENGTEEPQEKTGSSIEDKEPVPGKESYENPEVIPHHDVPSEIEDSLIQTTQPSITIVTQAPGKSLEISEETESPDGSSRDSPELEDQITENPEFTPIIAPTENLEEKEPKSSESDISPEEKSAQIDNSKSIETTIASDNTENEETDELPIKKLTTEVYVPDASENNQESSEPSSFERSAEISEQKDIEVGEHKSSEPHDSRHTEEDSEQKVAHNEPSSENPTGPDISIHKEVHVIKPKSSDDDDSNEDSKPETSDESSPKKPTGPDASVHKEVHVKKPKSFESNDSSDESSPEKPTGPDASVHKEVHVTKPKSFEPNDSSDESSPEKPTVPDASVHKEVHVTKPKSFEPNDSNEDSKQPKTSDESSEKRGAADASVQTDIDVQKPESSDSSNSKETSIQTEAPSGPEDTTEEVDDIEPTPSLDDRRNHESVELETEEPDHIPEPSSENLSREETEITINRTYNIEPGKKIIINQDQENVHNREVDISGSYEIVTQILSGEIREGEVDEVRNLTVKEIITHGSEEVPPEDNHGVPPDEVQRHNKPGTPPDVKKDQNEKEPEKPVKIPKRPDDDNTEKKLKDLINIQIERQESHEGGTYIVKRRKNTGCSDFLGKLGHRDCAQIRSDEEFSIYGSQGSSMEVIHERKLVCENKLSNEVCEAFKAMCLPISATVRVVRYLRDFIDPKDDDIHSQLQYIETILPDYVKNKPTMKKGLKKLNEILPYIDCKSLLLKLLLDPYGEEFLEEILSTKSEHELYCGVSTLKDYELGKSVEKVRVPNTNERISELCKKTCLRCLNSDDFFDDEMDESPCRLSSS
ncbi:hypothetical protein Ddc_03077 [Ditylenchus destructor]|nr:hypothetical protein Ddc_03077 [Ditylenchus destructor]